MGERNTDPPAYSVVYRPPFALTESAHVSQHGYEATIAELVAVTPGLPSDFLQRGMVRINDHDISRAVWHRVKPRPGTPDRPVIVSLHYAPRGGGSGSGTTKAVVGLVATIALSLALPGIGTAIGGSLLGAGVSAGVASALGTAAAGAIANIGAIGATSLKEAA